MLSINVIGLGYIGLPTALMLAENYTVFGSDKDPERIRMLTETDDQFADTEIWELLEARADQITFSVDYHTTDLYIVAVPTPYDKISKKVDIAFIEQAIAGILKVCKEDSLIVIESTISPGTIHQKIRKWIELYNEETGRSVGLAHAPERIIPGNMIHELQHNPRIIGVDQHEQGILLRSVYGSFCQSDIIITDIKTAEMTKVIENTYRDINIAFANELAVICRECELDVYEVIQYANMHPRVHILQPGPGVGGHCIPVDPWFLAGDYPGLANMVLAARKMNDSMPEFVLKRVQAIACERRLGFDQVGFYGLTYKENVDDMRESPALQLLERIKLHLGPPPKVYDPLIRERHFENQYLSFTDFLADIRLVVIMVGHDHILESAARLKNKVVLDTRNVLRDAVEDIYFL